MKHCNTCNTTKDLTEFYPKRSIGDYMSKCKECSKAAKRAWAKANREHLRNYENNYRDGNVEYKTKQAAYMRKHQQDNKAYWNAKNSKHRADKILRTPEWLDEEQLWIIQEFYELAQLRTEATGVLHHVDHIIPLNGQDVSGLHVPMNLQVIPWYDNLSKSNRLEIN